MAAMNSIAMTMREMTANFETDGGLIELCFPPENTTTSDYLI